MGPASAQESPGSPNASDPSPADDAGGPGGLPAVVAVLVSTGGAGMEAALGDLVDQDYEALTVLVLDCRAAEPLAERTAAVAPRALIRRLPEPASFAEAANDALTTVEGAMFLVFVADDVRVAPDLVRRLVEEAFRSNAGILAPKLVDIDAPGVLVDVGFAVDHYGVRFDPIEPRELDQEQHDAVRDTFGVSGRVMAVRADLFRALDGFDPACGPAADADLCWRAHLAGARVMIVPDAVARARPAGPVPLRAATAGRVRAVAKAYSSTALAWALPVGFVLALAEAVAFVLARRPGDARASLAGWFDALRARSLRAARRATQAQRQVDDRDVRVFMIRGSARLRAFVTRRLRADERLASASLRTRSAFDGASLALHRNESLIVSGLLAVVLIGGRGLLSGPPTFRGLAHWPAASDLWRAFTTLRPAAPLAGAGPAPTLFGLASGLAALLGGRGDLARAVAVGGALPLGVYGAYRLARPFGLDADRRASAWPAVAAAVAYAANPTGRNAAANGDLGALVLFALAPFVVGLMWAPMARSVAGDLVPLGSWGRRRQLGAAALLTAVAGAAGPLAVLLPLLVGLAAVGAAPFVRGLRGGIADLRDGLAVSAGAAILLLPWSATWLGADPGALGLGPQPPLRLGALLAFRTGPNGAGWLPYGLLAAALLPLVLASGDRLRWAARAWVLVAVSFGGAFVIGRASPGSARPALDTVLVPAALGVAIATGAGVGAFVREIRSFVFGARQAVAIAAAAAVLLPGVSLLGDVADGRFRAPARSWADAFAFMTADALDAGPARTAWIGGAAAQPAAAPIVTAGRSLQITLTTGAAPDVRDLFARSSAARDFVGQALDTARRAQTARLGHLLAPLGVRYLVVANRVEPGGIAVGPDAALLAALDAQLDIAPRDVAGARVYVNEAWFPIASRLRRQGAVPVIAGGGRPGRDPVAAILATDLSSAVALRDARATGPVLLAEAYSARRRAVTARGRVPAGAAFGLTDVFRARPGPVRLVSVTPWWYRAAWLAQILGWLLALGAVVIGPRRARRSRVG